MASTTIFKNNQSQAVRLPKDVAFPEDVRKVNIIRVGSSRIITPSELLWDDWFNGKGVSEDFMEDRSQPKNQPREAF